MFRFGVIADTHMNPEDDRSSSPWETNKLSNTRTRSVIADLNALQPAFVVHLGDLIHPVPELDSYADAAIRFRDTFEDLNCPLYLVPGNHDVGDKPAPWMPAGTIKEEYVNQYRKYFGKDFYKFEHDNIVFIVINCQLINSGLSVEEEQRIWLEKILKENNGKRCFLFTHYPLFICEKDEEGHYDNLDEPGRGWLLKQIQKGRVEAVFAGHVHNFFYNRTGETSHYILPSTSFVRHDYSELSRIAPAEENGRNDLPKLGFMVVDVFPENHVATTIRTYGKQIKQGDSNNLNSYTIKSPSIGKGDFASIGIDLRQDWAEVFYLPYNGALDEFVRKKVRNDYLLLALQELGLRDLRIPASDLNSTDRCSRMSDLKTLGHRFSIFRFGLPSSSELHLLKSKRDLYESLELVLADIGRKEAASLMSLRQELNTPIYISQLRTSATISRDSEKFNHFVNHGFLPNEAESINAIVDILDPKSFDGFVFRIGCSLDVPSSMILIDEISNRHQFKPLLHVRLSSDNPATIMTDEKAHLGRVIESLVETHNRAGRFSTFLDSFVDNDRGYFPRDGLIDRRFNPNVSGKIFKNLVSLLVSIGRVNKSELVRQKEFLAYFLDGETLNMTVLLPNASLLINQFFDQVKSLSSAGHGKVIDLETGALLIDSMNRTGDSTDIDKHTIEKPVVILMDN